MRLTSCLISDVVFDQTCKAVANSTSAKLPNLNKQVCCTEILPLKLFFYGSLDPCVPLPNPSSPEAPGLNPKHTMYYAFVLGSICLLKLSLD